MRLRLFFIFGASLLVAPPVWAGKPASRETNGEISARFAFRTLPGCPPERVLVAEIASWVGYEPFSPEGESLVTAWFERVGPLYRGSFTITYPDGRISPVKNSEAARRCSDAYSAMGISVGSALTSPFHPLYPFFESERKPALAPPSPPPSSPPSLASPPLASPLPAPAPVLPLSRPFLLASGVDGVALPVVASSAMVAISVWAAFRIPDAPWSLELDLRAAWSVVPGTMAGAHRALSMRSKAVSGIVRPCWRWTILFACAMVELRNTSIATTDIVLLGHRGSVLRPALGLRGGLEQPLVANQLMLRSFMEVEGWPITSPAWNLNDIESALRAVSFSLGLGLAVSLW